MWNNIQTNSSMGLQMLSTSSKRPREDYLNGDADDDGPAPAKMCKQADDSAWSGASDYYAAGKCYQCGDAASAPFYGGPFAGDHYGGATSPTHQCWPAASAPSSQPPQQLPTSPPHPSQPSQPPHQPHHLHLHPSHLPHHQSAPAAGPHLAQLCAGANHPAMSPLSGATATYHPIRQPTAQQQTIRCDENGKSYLDLGSGSSGCLAGASYCAGPAAPNAAGATTVASARTACHSKSARCGCGIDDYERRRINVLNLSMFKLGKYRAFPDPSLYRSVLICNTLRHIEREMEQEGCFGGGGAGASQQTAAPPFFALEPPPEPPRAPTPYPQTCAAGCSSGADEDGDSGIGDDNRSINWGSVLSLSSQSDLDPLNNNDSLGELDFGHELDELIPASCKLEDILKQVPSQQPPVKESPDIENIMQVLRFTTS